MLQALLDLSMRQKLTILGLLSLVISLGAFALNSGTTDLGNLNSNIPSNINVDNLEAEVEIAKLKSNVPVTTPTFDINYNEQTLTLEIRVKNTTTFKQDLSKWLVDHNYPHINPDKDFTYTNL